MQGWNEGIVQALDYIENHLAGTLELKEIARQAHVSSFYFQKIFHVLAGLPLGEYIRLRRLTLAAQELCATERKVIDVALKYGYASPDSFTRAFIRFHGVSPSSAREQGCPLNSFAPLKIKLTLEGGTMLSYKIVSKEQFTLVGIPRKFHPDTAYREIPLFWEEHMASPASREICGMFGLCMDDGNETFDYWIADNYLPWKEIPAGCAVKVIPAGTWAVFPCAGPLPEALQSVNTRIWSEWLPSCKAYKLAGNYNIEFYAPPSEDSKDDYNEIWLPVEKAE